MKEHTVEQGSPEWLALRQNYFTASEAPAMMGDSTFTTRDQLLHQKKTGSVPEVGEFLQKKFDEGHAAEESARPLADAIVGSPLFPTTGTVTVDGLPLLASFDGITFDNTKWSLNTSCWNPRSWLGMIRAARTLMGSAYFWQLEQQLLVANEAERVFCLSAPMVQCCQLPPHGVLLEFQDQRRAALIAGWHQFQG